MGAAAATGRHDRCCVIGEAFRGAPGECDRENNGDARHLEDGLLRLAEFLAQHAAQLLLALAVHQLLVVQRHNPHVRLRQDLRSREEAVEHRNDWKLVMTSKH